MTHSSITHISTVHPAFDVRIFHKECKSLVKQGFKVNLIVSHEKEEMIDGVRIIPLPFFKGRFKRMLIKPILAFIYALKLRSDLYHFHDPELIPVGILLKIFGKKVVYDVHEDVPSQIMDKHWIPSHLRRFVSIIVKGIEKCGCLFFDGIVAATPYIRNKFLKMSKNAIDINNYPLTTEFVGLKLDGKSKNKTDKIICYIGAITKERGAVELVKAVEGTDIRLYLAGTVAPKNLLESLEKEEGWKNVTYFGQVERDEVVSILSKSQIGLCILHPTISYVNSLPVKLFEYMTASLPVVVSDFPYWRKLFGDFESISFVDPFNPEKIRNTIQALISDPKKCHSMGQNGLKAIKEIYNWESEEKKLIDFYKDLDICTNP
ncbi:MAG: glycosyltransferase family 4 protein [Alphaproteobacteria bacterium]|nr:glycosyltransferase family 4 protein [Alphaproteobacteria bacterium]